MDIYLVSGNKHKLNEFKTILEPLGYSVKAIEDVDNEIVEDGSTFEENAIIKAKAISDICHELVLADDSGLEVDYMDKMPGIYSARFLGEDTSYSIKNKYIMDKLEGVPDEKRTARFVCAIAAAFPDGEIITRRATIEGIIGYKEEGENGFGYDPIFYVPEYGCSTASLSPEQKNEISHRGKALKLIKEEIERRNA